MVVVAFFVSIFGLLAVLVIPNNFESEVVIVGNQLLDTKGSSGDTNSSSGTTIDISLNITASEAIAMITSRSLLSQYITDHNLLPILFAADWDSKSESWHPRFWKEIPTVLDGYTKMLKLVDVATDKETNLTTVSVLWTDPELSKIWATGLVSEVNRILRKRAIDEAQKSLGFLEKELQVTKSVELQQALYELVKQEKARIVAANVYEEYAFRSLDPAVTPEDPAIPYLIAIMLAVGVIMGLFFGVSLALLLNLIEEARTSRLTRLSSHA